MHASLLQKAPHLTPEHILSLDPKTIYGSKEFLDTNYRINKISPLKKVAASLLVGLVSKLLLPSHDMKTFCDNSMVAGILALSTFYALSKVSKQGATSKPALSTEVAYSMRSDSYNVPTKREQEAIEAFNADPNNQELVDKIVLNRINTHSANDFQKTQHFIWW